ncbi:hypothetical protein [Roseivirga misakiensis]|uniref:Uncharacterized protein n=1 Tax=Roseivirga misakiensis TaxID=1563681 RepID=A0A1E5T4L2_9BACT|nr:hypothetical protein [Roseivirga misakiensis]OEK06315.1 hypothetical protein BFP71_01165 [Roseivirga misakiensis]
MLQLRRLFIAGNTNDLELKNNKFDDKNTQPTLNKLDSDYTKHLNGDLADSLCKLADDKFYDDNLEFVFQLLEAELRATDSIALKAILESIREKCMERWDSLVLYATKIEQGEISSAVSHQVTALIELIEES